jgi:hypothetical protein
LKVGWNGDDDGDGYIVQEVDFSLLTPGGNEIGTLPPFTLTDDFIILGPALAHASVMHDDNQWDRDGQQFVVSMSAKEYLFATGEDINYTTVTELKVLAGGKTYTVTGTNPVVKEEGAEKDPEGYIAIEPTLIEWDRDGGIFEGAASVTASISLVGPSGNVQGDVIVTPPTIIEVMWPDSPVKHENTGWDYDPENDAIVVPLLAHSGIVDIITKGYQVEVDVDVWNLDGSDAGSGEGSAAIVKIDGQGGEYVQIQPALAVLDDGVSWNGDDDGSNIVSGTITLVSNGTVHSITTFEKQEVGFVIHEPAPEH